MVKKQGSFLQWPLCGSHPRYCILGPFGVAGGATKFLSLSVPKQSIQTFVATDCVDLLIREYLHAFFRRVWETFQVGFSKESSHYRTACVTTHRKHLLHKLTHLIWGFTQFPFWTSFPLAYIFYRCGMNLNWMFFSYFIVCAGNVPIMNRDITRTGTVMLLLCGFNSLQLALNKEKFSAKATAYHQLLMIYKCQFGSTQCLFAPFTVILFNVSNQEQKLPANPVWLTCKDGKDRPWGRAPVITFIFTPSLLHLHM